MNSGFVMPPFPRTDYGRGDVPASIAPHVQRYQEYRQARSDDDDMEEFGSSRPRSSNEENRHLARLSREAPRIPWADFLKELEWKSGEHFAMIGPTGQGKTTMLLNVLPLHPYVVVFATKPRDDSMQKLINAGYLKMDRWRSLDPVMFPRRVLWPDATTLDSEKNQKEIFKDAFNRIYREGGWTIAIDELWYIINVLSLQREVRTMLLQARALGISLVCATQRPAYVPLEVYDQSTHLMFWRDNDETNLKRISGLASASAGLIRRTVQSLDRYQVLYINTRTGRMLRTRCPAT